MKISDHHRRRQLRGRHDHQGAETADLRRDDAGKRLRHGSRRQRFEPGRGDGEARRPLGARRHGRRRQARGHRDRPLRRRGRRRIARHGAQAERATGVGFIILNAKRREFHHPRHGRQRASRRRRRRRRGGADRRERRRDDRARSADLGRRARDGARPQAREDDDPQSGARPRPAGLDLRLGRLSDAERERAAHPPGPARGRSAIVAGARAGAAPARGPQHRHDARARGRR